MPTITPAVLGGLLAAAGGAAAGIGSGVSASMESDAASEAADKAALGPVRGGTDRAGGAKMSLLPDMSKLEKLGQTALPMQNPVYGGPIDLAKMASPQQFGAGYTLNANRPGFPNRFNM